MEDKILLLSASHDMLSEGHTGLMGNEPEERKRRVLEAFKKCSSKVEICQVEQPEQDLSLASCVHEPGMLSFLECAWQEWAKTIRKYPNSFMLRVFSDCSDPKQLDQKIPPFMCRFGCAPRHDSVQDISSASILAKIAYYCSHMNTPIHESTLPSLKWDLAVTRTAVAAILSGRTRVAYAQVIHPGHHAGPSSYGGFCFLNHAAIAARLLQPKHKRVAVIDVDYHHGNGTMAVFWNDPSVFFASLHGDPNLEYPFTCGFAHQMGGENAKGSTMNVPLPGGTEWPAYQKALQTVIERVRAFGAEALVISLGLDTLKDDPVTFPQSRFSLKQEDFIEMGEMLLSRELRLPTVVVQEGGYQLDKVPVAVLNFLLRPVTTA